MITLFEQEKDNVIVIHYNKKHNEDQSIPPWVVKSKGESYYINHFEVSKGIGFSTKETPDNPHTKGSLKFKGKLKIIKDNCSILGQIY